MRLPCRQKPERLRSESEQARVSTSTHALVVREKYRDNAAQANGYLFDHTYLHAPTNASTITNTIPKASASLML
jgi:hypothetical protein